MKFCENCGAALNDNAKFCTSCGREFSIDTDPGQGVRNVTENIVQGPDGVYHWAYDLSLWKNPTILFTIWKVFGITFAIMVVIFFFIQVADGELDLTALGIEIGVVLAIFVPLTLISYAIYALCNGGKYCVLFEMNEKKIAHIQAPKQFKKARKAALLEFVLGAASGNPTLMGQSAVVGNTQASVSTYTSVTRMKIKKNRNTIHLSQGLFKNQIYAEDADFDFVESFIRSHCEKARIR
ncbi:MAG: zinc-ribbon domain-containing protein [Lachnospiraceae bacterium]|nr:zinc-ribbon domain-containing protein [Lachnospiraceae bacterium]